MAGAMVSVVSRSSTTETQNKPSRQSVSENPQPMPVRIEQRGQRLVEVERDHRPEQDVEEHQGRAPEPLAGQGVGQPQDQPDDDQVDDQSSW